MTFASLRGIVAPKLLAPALLALLATGATAANAQAATSTPVVTVASTGPATSLGQPLTTTTDITGAVSVDAVLLPYSVARRSFGKEVARKYAVVSMIVSNRDARESLILHSALLDYSQWLFSGSFVRMSGDGRVQTSSFQQQNQQAQVASAEVRTVRADLQDAQLSSVRSLVVNILTSVGTTAATLSYSTGSDLFSPSVAAFNGAVVPGIKLIWPDSTQTQVNLISDIGFRTNRVISAKSSDVVIAFFPLDRFLTPTLRKLYLDAPAAFFNPSELLLEDLTGHHGTPRELKALLDRLDKTGLIVVDAKKDVLSTLAAALREYETADATVKAQADKTHSQACSQSSTSAACVQPVVYDNPCTLTTIVTPDHCLDVNLLNRVSLNRIRLVIGGTMTVDVASIPATVSSVTINNGSDPATWAATKTISGVVNGTFLSGASLSITATDPTGAALSNVLGTTTLPADSATDAALPFTVNLTSALAAGTRLSFVVAKTASDKSTTASAPFVYTVGFAPQLSITADTAAATWVANSTVSATITGTGLLNASVTGISGTDNTGKTLPSTDFGASAVGSGPTDLSYTFTFKLNAAIPVGSKLSFTLQTVNKDGTKATSTISYTVPAATS